LDITQHLQHALDEVSIEFNTIVILAGDLNAHHPDLSESISTNTAGRLLQRFATVNALTQVIQAPTRVTAHSSSCLDILLTNIPEEINFLGVYPGIGTSDHGVACVDLKTTSVITHTEDNATIRPRLHFNTHSTNWKTVNDHFSNINWHHRFAACNVEETWTLFKDAYEEVLGRLSKKSRPPSRRTNHERHQHNTLNQELIRLRATQQAAWRLHSTARTRETHQSLVTARQEFTLACANHIRRTDEATVKRMTESSNAKQWHKYCKQLYRGSAVKEAIPIMTVGTESYITAKDKATILNQTFIAKSRASSRPRFPSLKKRTDSTLADILFNEYRVKKILQDLNINKASGPDGIQPSTLKNCSDSLHVPLAILFTKSFTEGVVPTEWKLAAVVPVYKNKGQRTDPNQYRPISLTSCVGKIMEKIINDALLQHLMGNELIVDNQFGFLPHHSTTDQIALLLHELLAATTTKKSVVACFLDLAAAFDSVPHPAILQKLPAYGVRGRLFRWIESYLSFRTQYVVVDRSSSPIAQVSSGVPQGSVIAPTLFLLFINDLCHSLSANTSLSHPNCHPEALVYADDTMLYRTGKDPALICPAIEEDLRIAAKWADIWGMRFNASKTVAMYISRTTATPPPITFAGATLEYSHEHRHLGFILDSALSFHAHVNALTRKGATEVFLLRRLSYKVKDRDLLLKIYKMYVRPHLEYASPAWAALTVTQTGLLESLQRRAMRIILALPRNHHITDADYAALNITSLRHRRNFALACFMFKLNSNRLPRKLSKYRPIPHTNPYNTRNCVLRAPYVPYPCLRLLDRSPFLFGLKILNFISHTFHSLPDISSFKSSLRESSYYMPLAQIYY
jgi:hypothetical protein